MGEYADDYYRQELIARYGFDPCSMYGDENRPKKNKPTCPKCGKHLKTDHGVCDHLRDYHRLTLKVELTGSRAASSPVIPATEGSEVERRVRAPAQTET